MVRFNGTYILTALENETTKLWDLQGELLTTFSGHTAWVNSEVFSPDVARIFTASADGTVKLWPVEVKD